MSYKEAKILIASYKAKGFDVRFIGGTSINGRINSVCLIPGFDSMGRLYFLVIPYNLSLYYKKKNEENEESEVIISKIETPKSLTLRKIYEESNLRANPLDLELLLTVIVKDNRLDFKGKKHIKFFYLLKLFTGELLNRDHEIFSGMKTLTPFFIPASLVAKEVFGGHLEAYRIALIKMREKMSFYDFGVSMNAYCKRKKSINAEYQKHKKDKQKQNIAPGSRE